jgi:hypothetical protein
MVVYHLSLLRYCARQLFDLRVYRIAQDHKSRGIPHRGSAYFFPCSLNFKSLALATGERAANNIETERQIGLQSISPTKEKQGKYASTGGRDRGAAGRGKKR